MNSPLDLVDKECASCSRTSSISTSTDDTDASSIAVTTKSERSTPQNREPQPTQAADCIANLMDQCWYWGTAGKELISSALENKRDGTFVVRDASANGQFTLTLRVEGANKLIKIMVENGKCGFTPDTLDFDSVSGLVQFYRTCSLKDFNERLDTCLLYPLPSPEFLAKEKHELEISSKSNPTHRTNILKCRLEGFHAEYDRVSRRYDHLFAQKSLHTDEYQRKKQTATAYGEALKIFNKKIDELKRTNSDGEHGLTERDREAIQMNIELQEERMEEIGKAQTLVDAAIQNIERTLIKTDEELDQFKPLLLKLHRKRDRCRDKILALPKQQDTTHAQLDRHLEAVSLALDSEPVTLSNFLIRSHLPMPQWDCENWLWQKGTTKEQAASLLNSLLAELENKDGIFLIRPSASRPGFYALEISKDGVVHSCLIEFRDTRTTPDHCGGYGFANTQMLFASLLDFVRYYANISLKEHNGMLDTPLTEPALALERKNQKRRRRDRLEKDSDGAERN